MKGIYLLILKLRTDKEISIGRLGWIKFKKGSYLYVGSAQNGISQRIRRHYRKNKKLFWHIDYLLSVAKIEQVWIREGKGECILADDISRLGLGGIKGFGCSDCRCFTHLFYIHGNLEKVKQFLCFKNFSNM